MSPKINEFVFNHVGTDFNEYVEILGNANTNYFNVWVLSVEGDSAENPGNIDLAFRFGTSDARGLVTTGFRNNQFENGTNTLLLVEGFTGQVNSNGTLATPIDLDANNDSTIDLATLPWATLIDSIAVSDSGSGDQTYSPTVLLPNFDGGTFTVGGASRFPNGTGAWVRNDFDAEGIPGFNGTLVPGEARNTPGDLNQVLPFQKIGDVQGTRHRSDFEGQTVTVQGVVTALANSPSFAQGIYIQDPNPDADNRTSEGIFVLTGSSLPAGVAVGDSVQVTGVVEEFRPGANINNLTITRLRSILPGQVTELSTSLGPIAPTVLGAGGRVAPTEIISSFSGFVEEKSALELTDGLDFYESLEGMLLQVNNAVAVSPTAEFGGGAEEIWVLPDHGTGSTGRNSRGGITVSPGDFNPERVQLDDLNNILDLPNVNVGDQLGTVTGVLSYDFQNYEILVGTAPTVTSGGLTREVTTLTDGNALRVATYNVENLDPTDGTRFNDLASIIVNNLQAPDIIALQEIQDNNGATNDGVVDANLTLSTLITAIQALDPTLNYAFTQINPVNNQDGGEPGGNIRPAYLYRADRVQLAPGTPGDSTTNTTLGYGPTLSNNPGRLVDTDLSDGDAFEASRKPLVAEFLFNGDRVILINQHFNSKGGDQSLFGPSQPPTLTSEVQRLEQAEIIKTFVEELLAADPTANVVVLGDLNDFSFSNPVNLLESAGLTNLLENLPASEQYTFNFQGNSQALDGVLASGVLASDALVDVVHVGSEFSDAASDHDPILVSLLVAGDLTGGQSNDFLQGSGQAQTLDGRGGDDSLLGIGGNDELLGGGGNDQLLGGIGNDSLNGGGGNDTLIGYQGGVNPEIDSLRGDVGADLFVLGDSSTVFYGQAGLSDYAVIRDFKTTQLDRIQLKGQASDYRIGVSPIAGLSGAAIFLKAGDDLIGVLRSVNPNQVNLDNASQFVYV